MKRNKNKKKNKNKKAFGAAWWSLNTMKFTFNNYDMIPTGVFANSIQISIDKQKVLNDYCSKAHLNYKKYLIFYICYFFGATYAYHNYSKIKFIMNEEFLFDQLNIFFKIVENRYKNPKKWGQYLEFLDSLPLKKNVNLNKNFYKAHLPKLKKKHLLLIVRWFLDNWKKNVAIERVFYGAGHYMSLEDDPILRDRKFNQKISTAKSIALKNMKKYKGKLAKMPHDKKLIDNIIHVVVKIYPSKFSKFKKSGLHKNIPLRLSYWYLANTYSDEINQCYLSSIYEDKFISNIILKGPNLIPYGIKDYHNSIFKPLEL